MATRLSEALPRDLRYGEPAERPSTQWSHGIPSAPRGGGSGAKQGPHETSDV